MAVFIAPAGFAHIVADDGSLGGQDQGSWQVVEALHEFVCLVRAEVLFADVLGSEEDHQVRLELLQFCPQALLGSAGHKEGDGVDITVGLADGCAEVLVLLRAEAAGLVFL